MNTIALIHTIPTKAPIIGQIKEGSKLSMIEIMVIVNPKNQPQRVVSKTFL